MGSPTDNEPCDAGFEVIAEVEGYAEPRVLAMLIMQQADDTTGWLATDEANLRLMAQAPRYKVTDDDRGCEKCGQGKTFHVWWIENGVETCTGTSWGDIEEAEYVCRLMNNAYEAGRLSCQK
jgi:hypothetical protein